MRPARYWRGEQLGKGCVCERAGRSRFADQNRSEQRKTKGESRPQCRPARQETVRLGGRLVRLRCDDGGACSGLPRWRERIGRAVAWWAEGPVVPIARNATAVAMGTRLARRCGDVRSRCPPALIRRAFEKKGSTPACRGCGTPRQARSLRRGASALKNGWNRAVAPASTHMAREPVCGASEARGNPGVPRQNGRAPPGSSVAGVCWVFQRLKEPREPPPEPRGPLPRPPAPPP